MQRAINYAAKLYEAYADELRKLYLRQVAWDKLTPEQQWAWVAVAQTADPSLISEVYAAQGGAFDYQIGASTQAAIHPDEDGELHYER